MSSTPLPSISAVLPAYNEEAAIAQVLELTASSLRGNAPSAEIIVVDDGSRDTTAARVLRAHTEDVPVRLVSHATNRGYGAALRTGFEAAACDAVWLMDSDGQFDPADLRRLLADDPEPETRRKREDLEHTTVVLAPVEDPATYRVRARTVVQQVVRHHDERR